jgi:SNF2 family DNA or RNA helicase
VPKLSDLALPVAPGPPAVRDRWAYQRDGVEFLAAHPRALLADGMRLGKSRQAVLAAQGRTLVVAPAMVLDFDTWTDEHARWRPDLDLTQASYHSLPAKSESIVVRPSADQLNAITTHLAGCVAHTHYVPTVTPDGKKATLLPTDWACAQSQPELVKGLRGHTAAKFTDRLADEYRGNWNTVIFDEAQRLKGHDTHWTKAAQMLAKRADQVWLLSGTPFPNWAHELWIALRLLRPEDAHPRKPLGNRWNWIEKWFRVGETRGKRGQVLSRYHVTGELKACTPECELVETPGGCEHWERFRVEELRDLFIRRTWEQVQSDLPPLVGADVLLPVSMTANQARAYKTLKREFLATLDNGEDIVAWNKAGLITKLRQVATGLDTLSSERGSGKLDAMQARLEGQTEPVLLVGHYHGTLDAIGRRLDEMGLPWAELSGRTPSKAHRLEVKRRYQAGDLAAIVGQVDTVAEGVNLARGNLAVIVEHSWYPDRNKQVAWRLQSPANPKPVAVDRLVTRGTVDAEMQELLRTKTVHAIRALPPRDFARLL